MDGQGIFGKVRPAWLVAGALAIVAYGHPHPEPHSAQPEDYDTPADLDAWHAFITAETYLDTSLYAEGHVDKPDREKQVEISAGVVTIRIKRNAR